ncbi:MAG: hypothetical protein A2W61_04420 [Deltaproteobacteria bacterium RIFCSPLOWO2_01_44_7]|nr:MAG: hypothetical protein A2712_01840 [Deltaproteobacteria bacterium RIFCSPHIGHO2_01_FULL_43_49]OGQ15132.1 MAG: hypothetical protein A3D22_03635 [Deltaproteobacteria bacterium RIFCSPHIGHO2_02_FULL_44_53]OGQ27247.1 MAG: hypothetical protein A3D98_02435 [Deltaproteobacteria bacterium RIFCSPHIGHO2_12_FULL_44_21]OGQ31649.1 MAG: hypothetical protein A2979_04795 [Deltaproteobacteria bacterium RIFCSPLOWO2_01_FULL_45_74]OGQ42849.1 MAG: hypothetical protein A3I70_07100 [Deltaproteobacteria bacterium 
MRVIIFGLTSDQSFILAQAAHNLSTFPLGSLMEKGADAGLGFILGPLAYAEIPRMDEGYLLNAGKELAALVRGEPSLQKAILKRDELVASINDIALLPDSAQLEQGMVEHAWMKNPEGRALYLHEHPEEGTDFDVKKLVEYTKRAEKKGESSELFMQALYFIGIRHPDPDRKQFAQVEFASVQAARRQALFEMGSLKLDLKELWTRLNEVVARREVDLAFDIIRLIWAKNCGENVREKLSHHVSPMIRGAYIMVVMQSDNNKTSLEELWKKQEPLIDRDLKNSSGDIRCDALSELTAFAALGLRAAWLKLGALAKNPDDPLVQEESIGALELLRQRAALRAERANVA